LRVSTPDELAARRRALVERSGRLRDALQVHVAGCGARLQGVDRGVSMARALLSRPVVVTAATALIVVLRPARALRWAARASLALSMARNVMSLVRRR
jgi:hypothetical protein